MSRTRGLLIGIGLLGSLLSCGGEASTSEITSSVTVPSGFTDRALTTAIPQPIALDFMPDGNMLVLSRPGKVYFLENRTSNPAIATALDITSKVCSNRERGLLGIAIDPEFASNKRVFLYYTFKKNPSAACPTSDPGGGAVVNRVSRFTYDPGTRRLQSEVILLDNILSNNGWHNAGDLAFGPDGYLYVTIGDAGADISNGSTGWGNRNSRRKSLLQGKVLRVRKDTGEPAPGNPWLGAAGSRRCADPAATPVYPADDSKPCRETFAWGLRNPYRIAFRPGTSTFFINEVGQDIGGDWEEINTGVSGADYGWNKNQGPDVDSTTTPPTHAYEIGMTVDGVACRCITGGTWMIDGSWDASYNGSYFFADYTCGVIFRIKQQNGSWQRSVFGRSAGGSSLVDLAFGPNPDGGKSLFYVSLAGNRVGRIDGPANNHAPVAQVTATPTYGATPLVVSFDGSASNAGDPGQSIIRYSWSFGDGTTAQTTTPTTTHTYTVAQQVTATLTVEDNGSPHMTASASVQLHPGNQAPSVAITSPADGATFVVGTSVTLQASASDAQDGPLTGAAVAWEVMRIHDDHTHPFTSGTGTTMSVVLDGPESLAAASTSHYRVRVTARDAQGVTASDEIELFPREVALTVDTAPSGLKVDVNGLLYTTPFSFAAWQGWPLPLRAPSQVVGDTVYVFDHWSDGGAESHAVTVPATATTYTATFATAPTTRINFQPPASVVPAGYLKESGDAFGARGNGLSYGWNVTNPLTRERNIHSDQRYDTTILMEKNGAQYTWEMAVTPGVYYLRVVAGDAQYFDGSYHITAEGAPFLDGTPSSSNRFVDVSAEVTVRDGRLTLANGTGSWLSRICFVELTRVRDLPFDAKINFQPAASVVPAGYLKESGDAFGARGDGLSYGWHVTNPLTRERNVHADQRYDTTILMEKNGARYTWEIELASGTYDVRVVAGDAAYFDGSYHITAEGQPFLDGTPTSTQRFVDVTRPVTVSDGRLTLANGSGSVLSRICFVEISRR